MQHSLLHFAQKRLGFEMGDDSYKFNLKSQDNASNCEQDSVNVEAINERVMRYGHPKNGLKMVKTFQF